MKLFGFKSFREFMNNRLNPFKRAFEVPKETKNTTFRLGKRAFAGWKAKPAQQKTIRIPKEKIPKSSDRMENLSCEMRQARRQMVIAVVFFICAFFMLILFEFLF